MSEGTGKSGGRIALPFGRIALILAALIAVVAVGLAIWKNRSTATTPDQAAASGAPVSDVQTMVARLEERLKASPDDPKGWNMLGWSYYETGRYADSAKAYRRATELEPGNADHWSALGEALVLSGPGGVTPDAEQAFRKAVSIDAADPRARYFLAVKKNMDGDHKGAVEDWIALLKDAPAGAAWAQPVRDLLMKVAEEEKIDIAGRVPQVAAAPAPSAMPPAHPTGDGATVASAGIPGPTREQMQAAASLPPGQQEAMVRGMVDGLAQRLKASPKDGDGWIRLMRARMVLGDGKAAAQALADARAAFAGDQAQLARFSEAAKLLGVPGA